MHPTQPLHVQAQFLHDDGLPVIQLTLFEDAVCQLIDDCCRWIVKNKPQPDEAESGGIVIPYTPDWTLEARVAGGWVRDKLLGQASHDFDISLSTLTGHTFALLLRQYLLSQSFLASDLATNVNSPFHAESDTATKSELVGHITKIAANPEQSKLLETATAKLAGLQLDFVNLRKEAYVGDSRIPIMQFGTAVEDAERRDTTINAMFYNIHTRSVEDLTGKGLQDLRQGVIRTPLEPNQTFLDDPLRVLRCVRFASRFGYTIDEQISACLTDNADGVAIRQALMNKVSRERFGIEVDKMLHGPDPARAIRLIHSLGLFEIVFGPPPGSIIRDVSPTLQTEPVWRAIALLELLWTQAHAESSSSPPGTQPDVAVVGRTLLLQPEVRSLLFYGAALLPLRDAQWQEKKDKWFGAGECVITNGLKLGRSVRDTLAAMHRAAKVFHRPGEEVFQWESTEYRGVELPLLATIESVDERLNRKPSISARATRALLLQSVTIRKPEFGLSRETMMAVNVFWAMIADLASEPTLWTPTAEAGTDLETEAQRVLASPVTGVYQSFFDTLAREATFKRLDERALLNGKEVIDLLEIPPGALVSQAIGYLEAWQLDHDIENAADAKEQCKAWLRDQWDKGGIVPLASRTAAKPAPQKKKKQKGSS